MFFARGDMCRCIFFLRFSIFFCHTTKPSNQQFTGGIWHSIQWKKPWPHKSWLMDDRSFGGMSFDVDFHPVISSQTMWRTGGRSSYRNRCFCSFQAGSAFYAYIWMSNNNVWPGMKKSSRRLDNWFAGGCSLHGNCQPLKKHQDLQYCCSYAKVHSCRVLCPLYLEGLTHFLKMFLARRGLLLSSIAGSSMLNCWATRAALVRWEKPRRLATEFRRFCLQISPVFPWMLPLVVLLS